MELLIKEVLPAEEILPLVQEAIVLETLATMGLK